jgi:hypothetical protein
MVDRKCGGSLTSPTSIVKVTGSEVRAPSFTWNVMLYDGVLSWSSDEFARKDIVPAEMKMSVIFVHKGFKEKRTIEYKSASGNQNIKKVYAKKTQSFVLFISLY